MKYFKSCKTNQKFKALSFLESLLRKGEHLLLLQKQLKQLEHKKELSAGILESNKGQDDQEARENFNQIRKELKSVRHDVWEIEEETLISILKIPNTLHPDTPTNKEGLIYINDIPKQTKSKILSHSEHALVEFDSDFTELVFLKGELALMEQDLCYKAQEMLQKELFADLLGNN